MKWPVNFMMSGILVILLSGCGAYNTEFDCPAGEGMRCSSLSKVDKAVTKGLIDLNDHLEDSIHIPPPLASSRAPLKIWMAPYVDNQGQFHESQETIL